MKKLVLAVLKNNTDAYNLFFNLKSHCYSRKKYLILEGAVFQRNGNHFHYKDGFAQTHDGLSFLEDGLLGHFTAVVAQPNTIAWSGTGMPGFLWIAAPKHELKQDLDFDADLDTKSFYKAFQAKIKDGQFGVVLHVNEEDEDGLNKIFETYSPEHIYRADAEDSYYNLSLMNEYQTALQPSSADGVAISDFHEVVKQSEEIEKRAAANAEKMAKDIHKKIESLTEHHESNTKS